MLELEKLIASLFMHGQPIRERVLYLAKGRRDIEVTSLQDPRSI